MLNVVIPWAWTVLIHLTEPRSGSTYKAVGWPLFRGQPTVSEQNIPEPRQRFDNLQAFYKKKIVTTFRFVRHYHQRVKRIAPAHMSLIGERSGMTAKTDATKKKNGWRFWFWGIPLVLIGLPVLLFLGASQSVNRIQIDERVVVPPPELEKILARKVEPLTTHTLGNETATDIYRQFVGREKREQLSAQVKAVFPDTQAEDKNTNPPTKYSIPWRGGPLTEAQIRWMRAHAELVEAVIRFANTPGEADPIPEEISSVIYAGEARKTTLRWGLYSTMMQLLIADGWLKLHEGREEGVQSYLAIYRLSSKWGSYSNRFYSFSATANRLIQEWIEDPAIPKKNASEVLHQLNQVYLDTVSLAHRSVEYRKLVEDEYIFYRKDLIRSLNERSWKSSMFGYDLDSRSVGYYWVDVSHGNDYYLPRVDRMLATTINAMNNKKNASQYVRQFDNEWKKALDWSALPGSGTLKILENRGIQWWGSLRSFFIIRLTHEAALNLNRAALETIRDPQSATTSPTIDFNKDPDNPWRDPFTEKAFKVNQTTTQTLIYSLGPEREDHKGLVIYDTSRGVGGAGNIVIRVPH